VEKHTTQAVDLAKSVYEVAMSQRPGRVAARHRLSRPAFEAEIPALFTSTPGNQRRPHTLVCVTCGQAEFIEPTNARARSA